MAGRTMGDKVKGVSKRKLLFNFDLKLTVSGKKVMLSEAIKTIYPVAETFNRDEKTLFLNITTTYLKDFDKDNLSFTDLDDVFALASNKVFEYRLLKEDTSVSAFSKLEKLKKQNETIKESLATRRKDRLKDLNKTGITILDVAADFDQEAAKKKLTAEKRKIRNATKMIKQDAFKGNAGDMDVEGK